MNLSLYQVRYTHNNLYDDNNTLTNLTVTYVNGLEGITATGMRTGNNRTLYPETVTKTAQFESSSQNRSIKISGLSKTKKYNLIFSNSRDNGVNGLTYFTVNSKTVSLNASYNTNKTAQINGIVPNTNAERLITVKKDNAADYAFLNSLVIQSYDSSLDLLSPINLRVTDVSASHVSLQWINRSYNETGIKIWRSVRGATYSRIALLKPFNSSY